MKFLLIVASVVAVAVAGPTRNLVGNFLEVSPAQIVAGPTFIEAPAGGLPVAVGPTLVQEPAAVGPIFVEEPAVGLPVAVGPTLVEEPVAVGPIFIEEPVMPVIVGPTIVEEPVAVGPIFVEEPVAVGPTFVDEAVVLETPVEPETVVAPVQASATPLVQIILNINQAAAAVPEVPAIVPAPVDESFITPEPVSIIDEPTAVVVNPIGGVAIQPPTVVDPAPIVLPTPTLPGPVEVAPVVTLPDILN